MVNMNLCSTLSMFSTRHSSPSHVILLAVIVAHASLVTSALSLTPSLRSELSALKRHERTADVYTDEQQLIENVRFDTSTDFRQRLSSEKDDDDRETGLLVRRKRNFIHDIGRGVRRVASSLTGGRFGGGFSGPSGPSGYGGGPGGYGG